MRSPKFNEPIRLKRDVCKISRSTEHEGQAHQVGTWKVARVVRATARLVSLLLWEVDLR